jgi:hypothetical protein
MNAQRILRIPQRHSIVHPDAVAFNVIPWLSRARAMAKFYEEPCAVYRYADNHSEDVFVRLLPETLDAARGTHGDRLVIEAVVNPPHDKA